MTPLNLDIYYTIKSKNNSLGTDFLITAKGIGPIRATSGRVVGFLPNKSKCFARGSIYSMDEFNNINEISIIPKIGFKSDPSIPPKEDSNFNIEETEDNYKEFTINNTGITKIDLKEKGTLEFNNIQFLENRTLIDVKATGDMIYENLRIDCEEDYIPYNKILNRSFENDEYKYTIVLDKMDKNKEYKYRYYPDYNDSKVLENIITVKFE